MTDSPSQTPQGEMPFLAHLVELRDRLLKIILVVLAILLVLMPFANELFTVMANPLMRFMPEGTQMIAIDVVSPFFTPFKLALFVAVVLAVPYILYHFWAFVAPGLYDHEKHLALPLLVSSTGLFYLGMLFAYFVVFPIVFRFMISMTPEGVAMMTDISRYLEFMIKLFIAFGLAFEVPIATIIFVKVGITTPDALAQKRPYIIVGAFVIGMLMTPPDVISQTLLAVPILLLFEIGLFFSRIVAKADAEREQAAAASEMSAEDLDAELERQAQIDEQLAKGDSRPDGDGQR